MTRNDDFLWTVSLTNKSVLVPPVSNGKDCRLSNNNVNQTQEIKKQIVS